MVKPNILFSTPELHHPAYNGPTLRIENSLKALSKISNLTVYSRVSLDSIGGTQSLDFFRTLCANVYFSPSCYYERRRVRYSKKLLNLFTRLLFKRVLLPYNQDLSHNAEKLIKIAQKCRADLIWLGYGNISYPFLAYIKNHSHYKVVIDTDSVWSKFILRELPYVTSEQETKQIIQRGQEKEFEEAWGTKLADITTAVSQVDAAYYQSLAEEPDHIKIFSNVIDIQTYQEVPPPAPGLIMPCIFLAGTFWKKSPMEDAARWAIQEVFPLVRQEIPEVHFYIAGRNSDRILNDIQDTGITVVGPLQSVLPYLCYASVAIVPLRFESGTRYKILEAGACSIPVVSTSLGAEGIPVTDGHDILIADDPQAFTQAIVRLIQDRHFALKLADNLKILVTRDFSIDTMVEQGRGILEYLNHRNYQ